MKALNTNQSKETRDFIKLCAEIEKDSVRAAKVLERTGIYTKNGQLSSHYNRTK
ncbi:MAG: hypothetical protein LKE40_11870 [Spirochaetia bacterium]|nr:hypothetical protein [Spirochaetia bacterium]